MQKKFMAVLMCAFMAFAVVSLGQSAHAAPPEGKGHGNSKEKMVKPQERGGKSKGNHGGQDRQDNHGRQDKQDNYGKQGRQDKQGDGPGRADERGLISPGITAPAARDLAMGGKHTGYKALPPGIAKNLARGKPLPPGIAKKAVPSGMLSGLPVHPGYEWQVVGRDLVLMQTGTDVIADVLRDVFD